MNIDDKILSELGSVALVRMMEIIRLHSVGICEYSSNVNSAVLLGSGTLAVICGEKGIITAAHVGELVIELESISLVFVSRDRDVYDNVRVDVGKCPFVNIGEAPWNELGPDLCFIKLPFDAIGAIDCHGAVFKNIDMDKKRLEIFKNSPCMFFVGGFADAYTKTKYDDNGREKKEITFIHETGMVHCDDYEKNIVDVFVRDRREDRPEPDNFGGLSGSGVWKFLFDKNMKTDYLFFGVVYYQTSSSEGIRNLLFNSYGTVYRDLFLKMQCPPA